MDIYNKLLFDLNEGRIGQRRWEKKMANLLDKREPCPEMILGLLVANFSLDKYREKGESNLKANPPSTSITDIICLDQRYYRIKWEQLLSSREPNKFSNQPIRVYPRTITKTLYITKFYEKEVGEHE